MTELERQLAEVQAIRATRQGPGRVNKLDIGTLKRGIMAAKKGDKS